MLINIYKKSMRVTSFFMMIFSFATLFTGCFDKREVDDLAYAVAIGMDKGKLNNLKLTIQFAVPLSIGGSSSGGSGGGGGGEKSTLITIEAPTLYSGLSLINNTMSKQINISHAKLIVFSEDLAKSGLHKYLHALIRGREFRPTIYIAVSRCPADEYLKSIKPTLDPHPAKYYELQYQTDYTSSIPGTQLNDFYFNTQTLNRQAVATLASVSKIKNINDYNPKSSSSIQKGRLLPLEGDYKAGDIPKVGDINAQIMGMAIFNKDRMVGEADGEYANFYMMISGKYKNTYWTIPDPKQKNNYIVIDIIQSRRPQISVNLVGNIPHIDLTLKLEADIESIQSGIDYEMDTSGLEVFSENFIKKDMLIFLNQTAKTFKSDIFGFGKSIQSKFLTWNQWENFNWTKVYPSSVFNVSIDLKIRRPGLIIRTEDMYK